MVCRPPFDTPHHVCQPTAQVAVGVVLLPFLKTVMPKLLPLPFGRAVSVCPLPVTVACQLFCSVWLPLRLMVTTQLFVPLTDRLTLNRSDHDCPGLTLTEQPPGAVDVPPETEHEAEVKEAQAEMEEDQAAIMSELRAIRQELAELRSRQA